MQGRLNSYRACVRGGAMMSFSELQQTAAEEIQSILGPSLFRGISVLLCLCTLGPFTSPACSATSSSFCPL